MCASAGEGASGWPRLLEVEQCGHCLPLMVRSWKEETMLWQPSEEESRTAGSLKWTGVKTDEGGETYGAWVAEMDYGTAPNVRDRLVEAVNSGLLGYLPRWARDGVVSSLKPFLEKRYGWVVKPEWIFPTGTVLGALDETIDKLTRPGSAIIVPTPAYMPFLTIPGRHGREVIEVPSKHTANAASGEEAWSLDLEGIEEGLKAGAGLIILCNPWNPTGRVLTVKELRALNELVSKYDALVFSDEIHGPLVFGDPSALVSYASLGPEFAAHTVTATGASKAWNIAGLQSAQVILPDRKLREKWEEKVALTDRGPSALGAIATVEAYDSGAQWLEAVLGQIGANLDDLEAALDGTMADYYRPEGTYLAWIGFDTYDLERDPAEILREDYAVATNSGATLGEPYRNWIRVNAAMSAGPWQKVVAAIGDLAARQPVED